MIHENIKQFRKAKGMTQEELAVKLHIVRQTVSKWEKGLSVPDADVVIQLADLLGVSVHQLLGTSADTDTSAVGGTGKAERTACQEEPKRKTAPTGQSETRMDFI